MAKPNTPKIEKTTAPSAGGNKKKIIILIVVIAVVAVALIYLLVINPDLIKKIFGNITITGEVPEVARKTFVEMPKTNITENPDLLPPTGGELGGDVI